MKFKRMFCIYECVYIFRVRSIAVSPIDKSFLSASADRTVRVWDLRSALCQVNIHLKTLFIEIILF